MHCAKFRGWSMYVSEPNKAGVLTILLDLRTAFSLHPSLVKHSSKNPEVYHHLCPPYQSFATWKPMLKSSKQKRFPKVEIKLECLWLQKGKWVCEMALCGDVGWLWPSHYFLSPIHLIMSWSWVAYNVSNISKEETIPYILCEWFCAF